MILGLSTHTLLYNNIGNMDMYDFAVGLASQT